MITLKKLRYGEKPLTSFSFCFTTGQIYLPNYEDLYISQKETEFERLTNNPKSLIPSLTHEFLHSWIFENFDKNSSLLFDNIDKNDSNGTYIYSNIGRKVYKGRSH